MADWRIQLAEVFKKAKESSNNEKYIIGFCQKKDVLNKDGFTPKNPIFDFVLAKFYSKNN